MTTSNVEREPTEHRPTLFAHLANGRKRFVLGFLRERAPVAVPVADLATHLAAAESDRRPSDVPEERRRRSRVELHHSLLPALEDAALIERVEDGAEIRATDRLALEAPLADAVLDPDAATDDSIDVLFDTLADGRRRRLLSILDERDSRVSIRTLAREIAARDRGPTDGSVPDGSVDDVRVSLVHVHLPLLRDAALVDYDEAAGTVAPADRGDLEWIAEVLDCGDADGFDVPDGPTTDVLPSFSS